MRLSPLFSPLHVGAALIAALLALVSAPSWAADREAGVPLSPAEAAGAWTLEAGGHSLCALSFGADHSVKTSQACGAQLPARPTAWQPTQDGMKLMDASGRTVLGFGRWSNSLFVAHRSGGEDVQLRRGAPQSAANDQ